jgi:hypothetical protein
VLKKKSPINGTVNTFGITYIIPVKYERPETKATLLPLPDKMQRACQNSQNIISQHINKSSISSFSEHTIKHIIFIKIFEIA